MALYHAKFAKSPSGAARFTALNPPLRRLRVALWLRTPHIDKMASWQRSSTRATPMTKAELRQMLAEAVRNTRSGKLEANFKKGVLTGTLPKRAEAQKPAKKIDIKAAA